MFVVTNWVAHLKREYGPRGLPSHETFSVAAEELQISSVAGKPPPLSETISMHVDWLQNSLYMLKGSDLYPKDHNIQIFARNAGLVQVKKATHKHSRAGGGVLGPELFSGISAKIRLVYIGSLPM